MTAGVDAGEYARGQAQLNAQVSRQVSALVTTIGLRELTEVGWERLVSALFRVVAGWREKAAELARALYRGEYARHLPEAVMPAVVEVHTSREVFMAGMRALRPKIVASATEEAARTRLALAVIREVENAGRRQTVVAVNHHKKAAERTGGPAPKLKPGRPKTGGSDQGTGFGGRFDVLRSLQAVPDRAPIGWARVATGAETCAWCMMLISRGPIYHSAKSAGESSQWHIGCDCKAVPVFTRNNYAGRSQYLHASKLWARAVEQCVSDGQEPSSGNVLNALRRGIESGSYPLDAGLLTA